MLMKNFKILFLAVISSLLFASCFTASKRKSADYYHENKAAINKIRFLYDKLYEQEAFGAGFTDKSCKYYLMEVTTDTVRYIYNTEKNKPQVFETIRKFQYDTTMLREFAIQLKTIKCLWINKASFYVNGKKDTITFLSFKSALTDRPFVENKYYTLLFLNQPVKSTAGKERIKNGDWVRIDSLVYFTIGGGFR